jgi:ssDNA-binding Zn-finger/Zn-ribbon topoisomerase 1
MTEMAEPERPRCPDCNTPLRQIDFRPGKEVWVCPVALEAKRRGLLGKPGRKHKEALVYTRREAQSV